MRFIKNSLRDLLLPLAHLAQLPACEVYRLVTLRLKPRLRSFRPAKNRSEAMPTGIDVFDLNVIAKEVVSSINRRCQLSAFSGSPGKPSIADAYAIPALLRSAFEARGEKIAGPDGPSAPEPTSQEPTSQPFSAIYRLVQSRPLRTSCALGIA
jgi:hypothetical protein